MRKELFIPIAFILIIFAGACKSDPTAEETDSTNTDSLLLCDSTALLPDTTIWGHMGEGTSMNVVEFITDKGDTLYLCKEDASTGRSAEIFGSLRNESDLLAITTRISNNINETTLITCINATQMMGVWKNGNERLALYADGSASNDAENLHNWKITNGELVLTLEQKTEYGTTQRNDTMRLVELTDEELTYINKHGQTFKFTK